MLTDFEIACKAIDIRNRTASSGNNRSCRPEARAAAALACNELAQGLRHVSNHWSSGCCGKSHAVTTPVIALPGANALSSPAIKKFGPMHTPDCFSRISARRKRTPSITPCCAPTFT
ncbi:hypothetical protein LMH87_011414 [Akanthomyces muscarius]|uniref:Uncharacterized protein n=1 Tax=Akanthomyces muscarius TaxID=2231603 RepID=A0A9W8Q948_AKAMU|nr:hypothetical protein LMH87_011414 [Akanthomyces muscarius]KAJ4150674.1 hypothetical protein LMH87_011414 [Akanthomyces muscarius]